MITEKEYLEAKKIVETYESEQLRKHVVMQQREQLFDFLRWYSDERELNYSDSHILVMIDKYQKSNNCA